MVNKTLKAVVAALTLMAGGAVQASGNTNISNCCSVGGMNADMKGCNCKIKQSGEQTGRARGDVVRLSEKGAFASLLSAKNATGTILVPEVGSIDFYKYGQIRIAIGSFSLVDQSLNPKDLKPALKRIINEAAVKNPWAKSMVWVARALPGQTSYTEVIETYTDSTYLDDTETIPYEAINSKSVRFTLPATKNSEAEGFTIDFNAIK